MDHIPLHWQLRILFVRGDYMDKFGHHADHDTFANVPQNEAAMVVGADDQHHSQPSALATLAAIDTGASKTYVGPHEKLVGRKLIRGATVKAADGREMAVLQDGTWHGIHIGEICA